MSSAEKYANLLNSEDTMYLFKKLVGYWGNVSTAVSKCNISRKTAYDWGLVNPSSSANSNFIHDVRKLDIKFDTKLKVLEESLESLPIETLDHLTKRTTSSCADLLVSYLTILYEMAAQSNNSEEFQNYVSKFSKAISEFSGLIYNSLEYEVSDMLGEIRNISEGYGLQWKPSNFRLYDTNSIQLMLTEIVKFLISSETENPETLAERLQIPVGIVHEVLNIYELNKSSPDLPLFFVHSTGDLSTASWSVEPSQERIPATATVGRKKK